MNELKQEAPFAYKGIGPIIQALASSGIAQPVVELTPLMTIKGSNHSACQEALKDLFKWCVKCPKVGHPNAVGGNGFTQTAEQQASGWDFIACGPLWSWSFPPLRPNRSS